MDRASGMDQYMNLDNGNVVLTETGMSVPELNKLSPDHLAYLFFVYSASSPYVNYTEKERKHLVVKERTDQTQTQIEGSKEFKAALSKYMEMNVVPTERFIRGAIKKMEELLDYWNKTKVTAGNYIDIANSIKGSNGILEMYGRFKEMLDKEEERIRTRGESEIAMFETLENIKKYA